MRRRSLRFLEPIALAAVMALMGTAAGANDGSKQPADTTSKNTATAKAPSKTPITEQDDAAARIEGEKRFHANCSRCHQYPHKFPPRMFATIVRHMRVRATITDEDMRLILSYLTQ
jgi:mono/diheme cytochrome c family protein